MRRPQRRRHHRRCPGSTPPPAPPEWPCRCDARRPAAGKRVRVGSNSRRRNALAASDRLRTTPRPARRAARGIDRDPAQGGRAADGDRGAREPGRRAGWQRGERGLRLDEAVTGLRVRRGVAHRRGRRVQRVVDLRWRESRAGLQQQRRDGRGVRGCGGSAEEVQVGRVVLARADRGVVGVAAVAEGETEERGVHAVRLR